MSVNGDIRNRQIRHSHWLERFKSGEVNKLLQKMFEHDKNLRMELLKFGDVQNWTKSKQDKLIDRILKLEDSFIDGNKTTITDTLKSFGAYEAGFQAGMINSQLPKQITAAVATTTPSAAQVWSYAINRDMLLNDGRVAALKPFIGSIAESRKQVITDTIRGGFVRGLTTPEITRELFGRVGLGFSDGNINRAYRWSEAVTRTGLNHMASSAREKTNQENRDIIKGYQWISTLDGRTSAMCQHNDGLVYYYDDPEKSTLPGYILPPIHPNAIKKGELVTTCNGNIPIEHVKVGDMVLTHNSRYRKVTTVMCKRNDSKVLKIKLADGSSVSMTDDHPILTVDHGWILPKSLKIGDKLFKTFKKGANFEGGLSCSNIDQAVLRDSYNIETGVTKELVSYGIFSSSAGVSSSVNLNNNVFNDEISNVPSDRPLKFIVDSVIFKKINKLFFMKRWVASHSISICFDRFKNVFCRMHRIVRFHSNRGCFRVPFVNIRLFSAPVVFTCWFRDVFLTLLNRFNPAHNFNVKPLAYVRECCFADSKFSFNQPNRFSKFKMFFLNNKLNAFSGVSQFGTSHDLFTCPIISTEEENINDYVYNLSVEDDETYYVNNILVHNCRSATTPITKSWRELGIDIDEIDPGTRSSMNGSVPATETYETWFKKQDAEFQKSVLGPTRYKAWKDGKVEFKQFSNGTQVFTLEELGLKDD